MSEYKENKAQRRPFPIGTKIDVMMVGTGFVGTHSQVIRHQSNQAQGLIEVLGTEVGNPIVDWKIKGELGDILMYRKHEGETDEQG